MSEEKITETKETKCPCQLLVSEGFKKFLIVASGTFVGVYLAISLFALAHKPPMPPMAHHHFMPPCQHVQGHFKHHKDFNRIDKKFHKEFRGNKEHKVDVPKVED